MLVDLSCTSGTLGLQQPWNSEENATNEECNSNVVPASKHHAEKNYHCRKLVYECTYHHAKIIPFNRARRLKKTSGSSSLNGCVYTYAAKKRAII
jgi:hypothetical protein